METLDQRMRQVIGQLATSARMSKLISINAALLTEQLQHSATQDTSALKVVATEIQRLSDESSSGIDSLQAILDDVQRLTQTINHAGRQRMLSQKIMKLHLLQRTAHATPARSVELRGLIDDFERSLATLRASPLNTPAITVQLERAHTAWQSFLAALPGSDLLACSELNERLLQEMHAAVQRYEELAGTHSPLTPAARPHTDSRLDRPRPAASPVPISPARHPSASAQPALVKSAGNSRTCGLAAGGAVGRGVPAEPCSP